MHSHDDPDEYVNLGEEISVKVGSRKSAGIVVSARFEARVAEQLVAWSEREGKRVSQLVREAVIAYLSELANPTSKFIFHTDESTSVKLTEPRVLRVSDKNESIRVS
jgi:predicted DNA-binding protein